MLHAKPGNVSQHAKKRQRDEMGTLGSGNHYLEVQEVTAVYDAAIAEAFGLEQGDIVVMIHCGSRGLGHQIGTEFLKTMAIAAASYGIQLPDRELACAPINSDVGQEYLGAMRAAINCALANRQILTHLVREVFADILPQAHAAAAVRRVAQHLQSRRASRRWRSRANSTSTAKARRAPSAPATRTYPRRCGLRANRC